MNLKPGCQKYIPYQPISLNDRTWPNKEIKHPPVWCSVDLRDGNQALINPMNLQQKLEMFHTLVDIGVKEIEIGFPSASDTEYEICRELIEGGHIPDDVTIQVLVQARPHLIQKTFEAIQGAKNVILHFYNSTSTLQRKVVFKMDQAGITKIATDAPADLIYELSQPVIASGMNLRYEYSPESFMGTEMDYAVEICQAVLEHLHATPENKVILNLPSTVETRCPTILPTALSISSVISPPATAPSSPCILTMTAAKVLPPQSWACWPVQTVWRPPCSATASVPATWIWSRWP